MNITKNEKEYTVTEREKNWVVSRKVHALEVEYKISKSLCQTEAELREYIAREELF